jgi:hypothetical protein
MKDSFMKKQGAKFLGFLPFGGRRKMAFGCRLLIANKKQLTIEDTYW